MKKILNNKLFLYIPLLIIMIISFLNMQNAKLLSSLYQNNLIKQIIWYVIGFAIIFIINKINLKSLFKYTKIYYFISCLLLLLVLFLGKNINGAKAWFNLGFFSFQPSELMRLTLTLYLSEIALNFKNTGLKSEIKFILHVIIITLIPSILVFLEPDTGAIIFYLLIALAILIVSKIHKFWFILFASIIISSITIFVCLYIFNQDLLINLIGTSFFYRVERLITFKTESSYQLANALIAIGSASFLGTGLNRIAIYIPEAPTDFIFALSISNFGLLTGFIILICYFMINIFFINQYFNFKNKRAKFILASFIIMFVFQQVVNIGMNLGLLPIIGIPLPFLSYGGSTLIIYFIYIGIILNFCKKQYFQKEKVL